MALIARLKMAEVTLKPLAKNDFIEIWRFIALDNDAAADKLLDRIDDVLQMLARNPLAGRSRHELSENLRSFSVGACVVFYLPTVTGLEVVRLRSGYLDIQPLEFG